MAMIGKIKCDFCGFIGDLSKDGHSAMLKTPTCWAHVYPAIKLFGFKNLGFKEKDDIKKKLKQKIPDMHICPQCVESREVFDMSLKLEYKPEMALEVT